MSVERFGVIAGNGNFPFMFLREARSRRRDCVVIGLNGEADKAIELFGFPVHWVNVGHLGELISIFKKENIAKAVMCGQVVHTRLFTEVKLGACFFTGLFYALNLRNIFKISDINFRVHCYSSAWPGS